MSNLLSELHQRNPVLSTTAWTHVALFLLAVILSLIDSRLVMGINVWIKPLHALQIIPFFGYAITRGLPSVSNSGWKSDRLAPFLSV